jgi:DNA-binding beta-propeller fold protein YncE
MNTRFFGAIGAALLASTLLVAAQTASPTAIAMPAPDADHNAFPDFGYKEVVGWAKLPGGRKWGGISAIDIDRDGKSIWVFDRCESADDGCALNASLDPILKFDQNGKLVKSFGHGTIVYPHGIYIDAEDNVWIADGMAKSGKRGEVVRKYDRNGKLLLTIGEFGVPGTDPYHFTAVSDVIVGPDGSIYVADGHDAKTNGRVLKYDRNGRFILQWGKVGAEPSDFNPPHGFAFDHEGRLYVADRSNNRIQIFDQNGRLLGIWKQFGRPSGIYIDKNDTLYVADSLSNQTTNPGFGNGIRWGKIADGKVAGFIPWGEYNAIEAVVTDDAGNIYAGFTNTLNFRKFARN